MMNFTESIIGTTSMMMMLILRLITKCGCFYFGRGCVSDYCSIHQNDQTGVRKSTRRRTNPRKVSVTNGSSDSRW